jgi:hypothetical protein
MSAQERLAERTQFLKDHGWGMAQITALPFDMSFRRYYRLYDEGQPDFPGAMLMDAPLETENLGLFIKIARHLAHFGASSPRIIAQDEHTGFAIIEDFGDDTYNRLIQQGVDEWPLYELAIDALAALQSNPDLVKIDLPTYDTESLLDEAMQFIDWFYPTQTGETISRNTRDQYKDVWSQVFKELPGYKPTMVLRDYHVDNLIRLEGREGTSRCGMLDFQDALIGHSAYDLTSLLEDARRDITPDLYAAMRERYARLLPNNSGEDFDIWYDVLSAQRHAKIIGVFTRFYLRDQNPSKLCHIPRVMKLLIKKLDQPILRPVKLWFEEHLLNPEKEINFSGLET